MIFCTSGRSAFFIIFFTESRSWRISSWRKFANSRFNCSSRCNCCSATWYLLSLIILLCPFLKLKSKAILQTYKNANRASSIIKSKEYPPSIKLKIITPENISNVNWRLLNTADNGRLFCSFSMIPWMLTQNNSIGIYTPKFERCSGTLIVEK